MLSKYEKGRRWAFAVFRQNVELHGELGVRKSDKACTTCKKYVKEKRKNKTNLDTEDIQFYKGAVQGFLDYYNKKVF